MSQASLCCKAISIFTEDITNNLMWSYNRLSATPTSQIYFSSESMLIDVTSSWLYHKYAYLLP